MSSNNFFVYVLGPQRKKNNSVFKVFNIIFLKKKKKKDKNVEKAWLKKYIPATAFRDIWNLFP